MGYAGLLIDCYVSLSFDVDSPYLETDHSLSLHCYNLIHWCPNLLLNFHMVLRLHLSEVWSQVLAVLELRLQTNQATLGAEVVLILSSKMLVSGRTIQYCRAVRTTRWIGKFKAWKNCMSEHLTQSICDSRWTQQWRLQESQGMVKKGWGVLLVNPKQLDLQNPNHLFAFKWACQSPGQMTWSRALIWRRMKLVIQVHRNILLLLYTHRFIHRFIGADTSSWGCSVGYFATGFSFRGTSPRLWHQGRLTFVGSNRDLSRIYIHYG